MTWHSFVCVGSGSRRRWRWVATLVLSPSPPRSGPATGSASRRRRCQAPPSRSSSIRCRPSTAAASTRPRPSRSACRSFSRRSCRRRSMRGCPRRSTGTFLWGYNINSAGASWPARTLEARRATATTAIYTNNLVNTRLQKPADRRPIASLGGSARDDGAQQLRQRPAAGRPCTQPYAGPIPAVVHLHGAEVLSQYDGHPDAWFTPGFAEGARVRQQHVQLRQLAGADDAVVPRPHARHRARSTSTPGWPASISSATTATPGSPATRSRCPPGAQEVELMIQDRQFDTNGQLYFPDSDNPANLNGPPGNPDKHPFWIPEFFGDVITVNGKSWPKMAVQPRRYRFRVRQRQQRALLHHAAVRPGGRRHAPERPARAGDLADRLRRRLPQHPGQARRSRQRHHACAGEPIGNNVDADAGAKCLFLAPAERADVIVDFSGQAGKTFTLKNFAVIPFPSGGPVGFGAPDATSDGLVMQFKVDLPLQGTDTSFNPAGSHPALRGGAHRQHQADHAEQEAPADPGRGRGRHGQSRRPGLAASATAIPVESLINNTKWNGNREGTTTPVPGSASERPRPVGHRDAARGLDRALGGRQPDRRRAPDPHPPDPVPGDLAAAVRRRQPT